MFSAVDTKLANPFVKVIFILSNVFKEYWTWNVL